MSNQKFQPTEDRILVEPIKPQENVKTDGGIITDPMKKQTQEGIVYSVGPGVYARETGVFMPTMLAEGDKVVIPFGHGLEFDLPDKKGLRLMREDDVLLVVEKVVGN